MSGGRYIGVDESETSMATLELFNKVQLFISQLFFFTFQTFPFFGVEPTILNEQGEELEGEAEGYLVRYYSALQFLF